jgi:hypothetical protein
VRGCSGHNRREDVPRIGYRSAQCAHTGSDEKSNFLRQSPSNQLRKLMFEDSVKKAEAEARAEVFRGQGSYLKKSLDRNTTGTSASTGPFEELT